MKKIHSKERNIPDLENLNRKPKPSYSPRGKILKVKQGYNPNSSSIGSILFAMPSALFGIMAVFGAVSGLIMSAFMKRIRSDASSKNHNLKHEKIKNVYLETEDD